MSPPKTPITKKCCPIFKRSRPEGGKVIAVVSTGDSEVARMADHTVQIHSAQNALVPILSTVPFQLLSYHIAVMLDRNVDQPRNLAKSVTVE